MNVSEIEFGTLWTYSPWGTTEEEFRSKTMKSNLKTDAIVTEDRISMSEYVARGIKKDLEKLPFAHFFAINPVLVPMPSSSLTKTDTLWVPLNLANALVKNGLGIKVSQCLQRSKPIRKSHAGPASERPKALEHYESMSVQKELSDPAEILLIDDFITRGATSIAAANRLADAYPNANIRVLVVMKTITNPANFKKIYDPCIGKIEYSNGECFNDCIE
ncbi:MAG: phosphoribosyltransferase [Nitrosopumilus sp.]|nr:phosphoribosyltransferase [Nitrosopumilus sp.]